MLYLSVHDKQLNPRLSVPGLLARRLKGTIVMPAINDDNARGWQIIADMLSRQRPYPGRRAYIVRGRKFKGESVDILRHQIDKYVDVFRYGNEASHHMRAMDGRTGYVCLVRVIRTEETTWIKANYLVCEYNYDTCWQALSDAVRIAR